MPIMPTLEYSVLLHTRSETNPNDYSTVTTTYKSAAEAAALFLQYAQEGKVADIITSIA